MIKISNFMAKCIINYLKKINEIIEMEYNGWDDGVEATMHLLEKKLERKDNTKN